MPGNRLALDTNVAIGLLNAAGETGVPTERHADWVLPVQVVGELRFGALKSNRTKENLARVNALVESCAVLDTTSTTAMAYAEVRRQLQRIGRPIPENDLWIAASCLEHGLPLATGDGHFDEVEGLERRPHQRPATGA